MQHKLFGLCCARISVDRFGDKTETNFPKGKNMNLKRGFLALAAMILGVGFFGASPAQAYTPQFPCVSFNSPGTSWPTNGHFFICDGTGPGTGLGPSSQAIAVRNAANSTRTNAKTKLNNAGVDVFVFISPDGPNQYNSYPDFPTHSPVGLGIRGFTINTQGTGHPTPAIAVYAKGCFSGCPGYTDLDIQRATNHEIGHALDIVLGRPSQGAAYRNKLNQDFIDFDAVIGPVNFSGIPPSCNVGSNSQKLKCWFGYNVPPYSTNPLELSKEFFAEEYAAGASNGTLPPQAGTILKNYFKTGGMPPSTRARSYTHVQDLVNAP
jgi:hypothetical protein